jgi:hypothetical protein
VKNWRGPILSFAHGQPLLNWITRVDDVDFII